MAVRFCKGKKEELDFNYAVVFDKNIFNKVHDIFLTNKIEYIPLVDNNNNYICCCYDDKNADDLLLNKIYILFNSKYGLNKIKKRYKNTTIVSFNEIGYYLYKFLSENGCNVSAFGELWKYVGIETSSDICNGIYVEGNNGLPLNDLGYWKMTFPFNEYYFFIRLFNIIFDKKIFYNKKLLNKNECNLLISKKLKDDKPFMAARLGNTEAIIANGFSNYYTSLWLKYLYTTSGFYSKKIYSNCIENIFVKKDVDLYVEKTIEAVKNCDICMCCFINEVPLINKYSNRNSFNVDWYDLYSDFDDNSWIYSLKRKKILIISSFNKTILYQYNNREKIFKNFSLPKMDLKFYDFPTTYLGNYNDKTNFFDNYNKILEEIKLFDFDVALISAGAYGYLLAYDIKKIGKQAIELCSGMYPIFGIKNKTQSIIRRVSSMYNENWIFPLDDNIPDNYMKLEKGSYWE